MRGVLRLRPAFIKHLLDEEVIAARGAKDEYLSEVCEVYGGFLTAAGLFVELVEDLREHFHELTYANPIATFFTIGLSLFALQTMLEMVRDVMRGPHHG
jgi:hypothetical protein